MGKRKRDNKDAAEAEEKPKRVKNKEKYKPKKGLDKRAKKALKETALAEGGATLPTNEAVEEKEQNSIVAENTVATTVDDDVDEKDEAARRERKERKKKEKKERIEKETAESHGDVDAAAAAAVPTEDGEEKKEEKGKKDKKEKKDKKKKKNKDSNDQNGEVKPEDTAAPEESQQEETQQQQPEPAKNGRFIAFIGNLPFTASLESVTAHFAKIAPISVRVATEKKHPDRCRGFGFVEFEKFDRMQTCLKLYHHSSFDDGKSPARRINVELTAGGGGKSQTRKSKLKEKNQKLDQERDRLAKEQKTQRVQKTTGDDHQFAGVHPDRLGRMGGGR